MTPTYTPVNETEYTGPALGGGQASSAPSCGEYRPLTPDWDVSGENPIAGFELVLNSRDIGIGDTLEVTLRNVSDEEKGTGVKSKYDIQYRADTGWHSIFGTDGPAPWPAVLLNHEPGDGFQWTRSFTEDGLSDGNDGGMYFVCNQLDPGLYRFVYWNIVVEDESGEVATGAPFYVSEG
jgi:hypothetical protein